MREIAPAATPDEIEQVLRSGFARKIELNGSKMVANTARGECKSESVQKFSEHR
jgi:hypothetical protein